VVSVTANGATVPANMTSSANDAGYKDSYAKMQYHITDTDLQEVMSDELAVTFSFDVKYHLDGSSVVTVSSPNETVPGFEIVSVTGGSMVIIPAGESQPAGLRFNLSRIGDGEIASAKLKPIGESATTQITTPSVNITDSVTATYPAPTAVGTQTMISCAYHKTDTGNFQISVNDITINGDGSMTFGNGLPSLDIGGTANFDFGQPSETVSMSISSSTSGLAGIFNKGAVKGNYILPSTGSCSSSIKRSKRNLNITVNCAGVQVFDDHGAGTVGTVSLNSSCVLNFY
jgi:hypothetical protein